MSQFGAFAAIAQHLLAERTKLPVGDFETFIKLATPLVVSDLAHRLPDIAARATLADRWVLDDDLLAVAGVSGDEDTYTELIAWALAPNTHQPSALGRQRAWLHSLGLDPAPALAEATIPRTQFVTKDGRPDLLLQYDDCIVVIEAKTSTAEHETPSGGKQTITYPGAVRRELGLPPRIIVHMVFLTPGKTAAASPDAVNTTYAEFVYALMSEFDGSSLPSDKRWAYAALFTHLLSSAGPIAGDVWALIRRIAVWSTEPDWQDEAIVVTRLHDLLRIDKLLFPETIDG